MIVKRSIIHSLTATCDDKIKKQWDSLSQFILLLNFTHTYVLFAANLDDFRSIAKKFIPGKLADQLTDMASQNSMKYRQQQQVKPKPVDVVIDTADYTDEKEVSKQTESRDMKTTNKKRFAIKDQAQPLDFDQLVNKVRQQLEEEYKTKRNEEQEKYHYNKMVLKDANAKKNEETFEDSTDPPKPKVTTGASTTQDSKMYYEDNIKETEPPAEKENDGMFNEADLTKTNDSYEDYVTPERDNIFESDSETKTTKSQRVVQETKFSGQQRLKAVIAENEYKRPDHVTENNKQNMHLDKSDNRGVPLAENKEESVLWVENDEKTVPKHNVHLAEADHKLSDENYDQDYKEHKSEEVKAQTGRLFDDEPGYKPKKLKGTMIPTRHYFKMSSPNYYGKLPAVAEKYDFNEPLPEKDREPEKINHFVNPPAMINKKVKVN